MTDDQEISSWAKITTRRVVGSFLHALARSNGWKKIYIISPWISEFGDGNGMSFRQFLKRIIDDDATLYVVTRPPIEDWHEKALLKIKETDKANIALVPTLHSKLYVATTNQNSFALFGSANFTEKSIMNRELGVLVRSSLAGIHLFRTLSQEAADIYRSTDRKLFCQRKF